MQIIRRIEAVVECEEVPGSDRELVFLTRLLQLALGCRAMMREHKYCFPGKQPARSAHISLLPASQRAL